MKPAPGGTTPNCVSYLALRAPGGEAPLYFFIAYDFSRTQTPCGL
jgi:hypothetical protein